MFQACDFSNYTQHHRVAHLCIFIFSESERSLLLLVVSNGSLLICHEPLLFHAFFAHLDDRRERMLMMFEYDSKMLGLLACLTT